MVVLFHSGFFRANHCLSEIRDAFVSATPAKGWDKGADKEKKEELAFFFFSSPVCLVLRFCFGNPIKMPEGGSGVGAGA